MSAKLPKLLGVHIYPNSHTNMREAAGCKTEVEFAHWLAKHLYVNFGHNAVLLSVGGPLLVELAHVWADHGYKVIPYIGYASGTTGKSRLMWSEVDYREWLKSMLVTLKGMEDIRESIPFVHLAEENQLFENIIYKDKEILHSGYMDAWILRAIDDLTAAGWPVSVTSNRWYVSNVNGNSFDKTMTPEQREKMILLVELYSRKASLAETLAVAKDDVAVTTGLFPKMGTVPFWCPGFENDAYHRDYLPGWYKGVKNFGRVTLGWHLGTNVTRSGLLDDNAELTRVGDELRVSCWSRYAREWWWKIKGQKR